jgi:hypothetical protein
MSVTISDAPVRFSVQVSDVPRFIVRMSDRERFSVEIDDELGG